jgi:hypothetical protein
VIAISTHLAACGDALDSAEPNLAQTNGAYEDEGGGEGDDTAPPSNDTPLGNASRQGDDAGECPDACVEPSECGQICLKLKGVGSSCRLVPTANDLTRPPRSVHFDCNPIPRGPDGYDFDTLGHITLMGNTCAALQKSGPHRVTLNLGCPPR